MKHLKRYDEGLFDIFRKKSEDDKIVLDFTKRLERVKTVSPYEIILDTEGTVQGETYESTYKVIFDDVTVRVKKVECDKKYKNGWKEETQSRWVKSGAIRKNNQIFYGLKVITIDGSEVLTPSPKITEDFFELTKKVYEKSKYHTKINKIRSEMNPAADALDPDIYGSGVKESINESDHTVHFNDHKKVMNLKDKESYKLKDVDGVEFTVKKNNNSLRFYQSDKPENFNTISVLDHNKIMSLDSGEEYSFVDSKGKPYIAKRDGDRLSFIQDRKITESINEREVKFTNKRNPRLEIIITKTPDGRITNIENETSIRFPFSVGQILNRTAEVWACNNNFLMDGKDTCPEKKIFGIRTSDVPKGHEWRHIYPHKFK